MLWDLKVESINKRDGPSQMCRDIPNHERPHDGPYGLYEKSSDKIEDLHWSFTCIIFLSSTVSPFSATIVVKKLMNTSAMKMKSTQLSKTNHTTFWLSTWWLKKTIFIISQFTNLYFLLTNQNIDWDERWFLETRSWDLKSKENS